MSKSEIDQKFSKVHSEEQMKILLRIVQVFPKVSLRIIF